MNEPSDIAEQEKRIDGAKPQEQQSPTSSKSRKDATRGNVYGETNPSGSLRTVGTAVEHKDNGHDTRERSSSKATCSSTLKFDPLGGGSRRGKKVSSDGLPSAVEQELNMLMKELLGESGEAGNDAGISNGVSMKETLDALKATGLGGEGEAQGSADEEDSLSSALVDGIMRQLLSKDILYQPMKEIGERYPPWLEEKKDSLDPREYAQYTKQYQYIQKICGIYESDPDDFMGLMTLLQEMQECGQPPQDIIDELSPEDATSFASSLTGGSGSPAGQCVIS